jgi:hypothetical protein
MFWTFKVSFDIDILANFGLPTVLAIFPKNWAIGASVMKQLTR